MSRIPYLTDAEMTPRQRAVNAGFIAERGGPVTGPVAFWMRNPELGLAHERLRLHMERSTSLPRALSELAILLANRHFSADFSWFRHAAIGTEAGLDAAAVAAIGEGRRPAFARPAEQAVHDAARALLETAALPESAYAGALAALGGAATVELVAEVGYGSMLALSVNTFGPEEPDGSAGALPPLGPPPTRAARAAQPARLPLAAEAEALRRRGAVAEAAAGWSLAPGLAAPLLAYDAVLREEAALPPVLRETAILVAARFWGCARQEALHRPRALAAGLPEDAAAAIAAGSRPAFADPDAEAAWAFAAALLAEGRATDPVQERAIARLGPTGVVELTGVVGYHGLVALTLNAFGAASAAPAREVDSGAAGG